MNETSPHILTATVESANTHQVTVKLADGQTLTLPSSAVYGEAPPGATVHLAAVVPGSHVQDGEVIARAMLNELLSPSHP